MLDYICKTHRVKCKLIYISLNLKKAKYALKYTSYSYISPRHTLLVFII